MHSREIHVITFALMPWTMKGLNKRRVTTKHRTSVQIGQLTDLLFQVQGDRLLGHQPDPSEDVNGHPVADRHLGVVHLARLPPHLRHGHEESGHPADPDAHGRRVLHSLLRGGVGRVQEGQTRLLHLFLGRARGLTFLASSPQLPLSFQLVFKPLISVQRCSLIGAWQPSGLNYRWLSIAAYLTWQRSEPSES